MDTDRKIKEGGCRRKRKNLADKVKQLEMRKKAFKAMLDKLAQRMVKVLENIPPVCKEGEGPPPGLGPVGSPGTAGLVEVLNPGSYIASYYSCLLKQPNL